MYTSICVSIFLSLFIYVYIYVYIPTYARMHSPRHFVPLPIACEGRDVKTPRATIGNTLRNTSEHFVRTQTTLGRMCAGGRAIL